MLKLKMYKNLSRIIQFGVFLFNWNKIDIRLICLIRWIKIVSCQENKKRLFLCLLL